MKQRGIIRGVAALLIALLGYVGFARTRHTELQLQLGSGLFCLLFLALGTALCWFALQNISKKELGYALPLGLLFGLFTAVGAELFVKDRLDYSATGLLAKGINTLCLAGIATMAVVPVLRHLPALLTKGGAHKLSGKQVFFISWGVMILCWLPCYIAYCPGIFAYDIPTQLDGISRGTLSADHPLLHTLIAWGCMQVGKWIHSYTLGAAIYSGVQALALSASFAAVVAYLHHRGASRVVQGLILGWFALLPVHPLFAINATKDVLFAACTIVFLLLAAELLHRPQRWLPSVAFWIAYVLALVAMCLMRNTGIYVFFFFIPVAAALLPGHRLPTLILGVVCVVSFYGTQAALKAALNVSEGRFTEMLSVPLQQVARCAYDGVLSDEEAAAVEQFIPAEVVKTYSSRLADPVKNEIDREYLSAHLGEFVGLWGKLALRHPGRYIDAFLGLNIGYWYPEMVYPDARTYHHYIETKIKWVNNDIVIHDQKLWPEARKFYRGIAYRTEFEEVAVLSLLFKPGIYFWATLVLLAAALFYRRRAAGGALLFLLLSWLLQLLSPIALLRYAYPLMVALPLTLGCFVKEKDDAKSIADHSGV